MGVSQQAKMCTIAGCKKSLSARMIVTQCLSRLGGQEGAVSTWLLDQIDT